MIALGSGNGRIGRGGHLPALLLHARRHLVDGQPVRLGVAHNAAPAHKLAASLELRLDQHHRLGERAGGGKDGRQQQRGRNKRHIHGHDRGSGSVGIEQCARLQQTRVAALHQPYTLVLAQLHGDLSKAGIDGRDARRAVLQKAVGKAAGRSAHVECPAAGHVDLPELERAFQLESAAAHVAQLVAEQAQGGIRIDRRAGLVDLLLVDQNAAGQNVGARPLTAGGKSPFGYQKIQSYFRHYLTARILPPGSSSKTRPRHRMLRPQ